MNTEIIVITDRSGSMASIRKEVIGGYNKFLEDQKAQPGEARVTYIQFDNYSETVYEAKDLKDAPVLTDETFVPRGMTALHDALGIAMSVQGKRIHDQQWADLVVVCVITDGDENASHQYTRDQIKTMTAHAEKHGWKFIFLAANQDAFAAARNIGSSGQYAGNFAATAQGAQAAYMSTSATLSSMRCGLAPSALVKP